MSIDVVRGTTLKPASSGELARLLSSAPDLSGQLFIGYPILGTSTGSYPIDALLVSENGGVVIFDLVEGTDAGDYQERQDDSFNKLESKLKVYPQLNDRRHLRVPIETISFAPGVPFLPQTGEGYRIANGQTIVDAVRQLQSNKLEHDLYRSTLSAIESISTIRQGRARRTIEQSNSLGARLKRLEDSIATLDHQQSTAVIETVEGVQRIRGLAGSGKTIVLALKAAYLHAQHPDWRIAVTFNTRSLKGFFRRLIHNFFLDMTGEEPDWDRLRVIQGWGAPGGPDRDGLYFEFCRTHNLQYFDFGTAARMFGRVGTLGRISDIALSHMQDPRELYDAVLVDEAQDFTPPFLRLCLSLLKEPKRLVYAYDELQSLSGESLPSPEAMFGGVAAGGAQIWGDNLETEGPRRDIILQRCYRNSRPVLVTAHALGFGINRVPAEQSETGLIQMFDNPRLWMDVGYQVASGELEEGKEVVLRRTEDTSPSFLEEHSKIDELIQFHRFESEEDQARWLAVSIFNNLREEELRHDDIVVINPDPRSTRGKVGVVRRSLQEMGIHSHLAGVDTDADTFYRQDAASITLTGIYRVKGNEAGMVYVINAQDCNLPAMNLASIRNQLFTAITRSKSWVRVLGVGSPMDSLIEEYHRLKESEFVLRFLYPTAEQRENLRIVHRDMGGADQETGQDRQPDIQRLLEDWEAGNIEAEDAMSRLRELMD
ncbi:MAG: ATP-binding domain-containing protein [Chloroflexota bacterium]|nr:ATP-binding domain-containing protein [Chloroflexota bacterium]